MKTKMTQRSNANWLKPSVLAAGCVMALALPVSAADSLVEALTGGKASGQVRYRYETVDQEGFADNARASTVRTQLGYLTKNFRGFGAFLQFEDVRAVGPERYNSTINARTNYPVVADPADTEVNQAYLSYAAPLKTTLKYGRQVITYDNHRFVGDVSWRQNQQTFDAFSVSSLSLSDSVLSFAHVTNANRIFSDQNPTQGNTRLAGEFLNFAYKGLKAGSLVAYGYFLDYEPGQSFPVTASNKTLGLRFDGATPIGKAKLLYTAEHARQSDYKDGASSVDAGYSYGMLGVEIAGVQIKLNYEVLEGNGVYGLQTPFATLHAHNGWADKFLVTPADGLVDRFISVGTTVKKVNLLAAYHSYVSDNLDYDYDYGHEFNLSASWKPAKDVTLLVKYASYDGDNNTNVLARNVALARDVDKLWLQVGWEF